MSDQLRGPERGLQLETHDEITPRIVSNRTLGKEKTHVGKESARINQYFHTCLSNSRKICFLKALDKPVRMGVLQ